MFKYTLPALLCLLVSCYSTEPVLVQNPEENPKCVYIVQRIMNIQNIRDAARKDFDITVQYKKKGKVSEAVWHHEYHRWISQENKLATSANNLYEEARTNACF
jgi:hypothetical protein